MGRTAKRRKKEALGGHSLGVQKRGKVKRQNQVAALGRPLLLGATPPEGQPTAKVGDGDLSFACALVERLRDSVFIVATTLDSVKVLRRKYPSAATNVKRLTAAGMEVTCGVDCRELHARPEFRQAFTKIVFNFPHLGSDDAGIPEHQELLRAFLSSAAACLEPLATAEVHVTLKAGEPYASWHIEQLAKRAAVAGDASGVAALRCDRVVPFDANHYPGYTHRRTRGAAYAEGRGLSDENVVRGAKTYVFKLRKGALQDLGGTPPEALRRAAVG